MFFWCCSVLGVVWFFFACYVCRYLPAVSGSLLFLAVEFS